MIVHLIDGTYELFRHFYGLRRFNKGEDRPFGAVVGVLHTVLQMIETGATHVGVATDHVIESFRNRLWSGYKTGDGIERALLAQFHPLEDALAAMGVALWPMTELEADDALACAAQIAFVNEGVERVCIWTPDKDLAQCVRGNRVVQVDRRSQKIRNAEGVREKFGVEPVKNLATLRTDKRLFRDVDELRWRGPTEAFTACANQLSDVRLLQRCLKAQKITQMTHLS
jgi:5'-3' exonuclease